VFGDTPIGQYQAIQHPLADVKIRQEAVRLMTYRTARAIDQGEDPSKLLVPANSTKYLASELGLKAVDAALEALGGKGFDQDTGIIQLWETMRLLKLSPISNSLILNDIAERVLNLPRSR
jgi:acyl-CoA dehydrogenase